MALAEKAQKPASSVERIIRKFRSSWLGRNFGILLTVCAALSGIATYAMITSLGSEYSVNPRNIMLIVLVDLALILMLVTFIGWKLFNLYTANKRGFAGSRLQARIILMFSLVAMIPTLLVAVFSVMFFNLGLEAWFDKTVSNALDQSVNIADRYLYEHKFNIRGDILTMAKDLNRDSPVLNNNKKLLNQFIRNQAAFLNLTEAIIFTTDPKESSKVKEILAQTDLSFSLSFDLDKLTPEMFQLANNGELVIIAGENDQRVRALIKLGNYYRTYLIVGRLVDREVLSFIEETRGSVNNYKTLRDNQPQLKINFMLVFVVVAVLVLLVAIWFGITFASEMVAPISDLIRATDRVKAGDLSVRIDEGKKEDEVVTLKRAFNRMTGQLEKQRNELVETNKQTDTRRRFIEAVLSGISSGVIALEKNKCITLVNRAATNFLWISDSELYGRPLAEVLPEVETLLKQAEKGPTKVVQKEINVSRKGRRHMFLVRVVREESPDAIQGYIVTFDDITALQTAQRNAAWSDVARRIAHEIKNPLTPISLAADRLRKKYMKSIEDDQEGFDKYTQTIIRHVNDIGSIVEEFTSFGRMRSAELKHVDIIPILQDSLFGQATANPDITFECKDKDELVVEADEQLLHQVFTNLFKNAAEAVGANRKKDGEITVEVERHEDSASIVIKDNGKGFPEEMLAKALEPYVTTREKGTGLGLAIVKKVMDEHYGQIQVENITDKKDKATGAQITLTFPYNPKLKNTSENS